MENIKKISIIMPAYNAERTIKDAIKSVLNQTYKNFELIIVNDGSNDNTEKIIKKFKDKRIKYIKQENFGVAKARNTGIKKSNGQYISFLDADDFYLPTKLEEEINFLEKNNKFDLIYCNTFHFYDSCPDKLYQHKGIRPSGKVFKVLLKEFFGQLNTVLIPKKIFNETGLFDETSRHSEEWDLYLRIAHAGYKFGYFDKPLVKIRIDGNSLSKMENQWQMKKHNLEVFKRLFANMNTKERVLYKEKEVIDNLKIKLAFAYLATGHKKEFKGIITDIDFNYKLFLINIIVSLLPIIITKKIVIFLWQQKHKKLLKLIK